jgi:hypothetical protein
MPYTFTASDLLGPGLAFAVAANYCNLSIRCQMLPSLRTNFAGVIGRQYRAISTARPRQVL